MMRDTRTLKSLFPDPKPPRRKNFIKENVESLRRMEQIMHTDGSPAKGLKLPILRKTRLSKTSDDISNVNVTNGDGRSQHLKAQEITDETKKQNRKKSCFTVSNAKVVSKKLPISSTKKNLKANSIENLATEKVHEDFKNTQIKCKSQGVQTLDTDDINSLYSEGVIRYPSGRAKELKEPVNIKNNSEYSENESQLKSNKETKLSNKLASQLNAPPPSYRIGVVPKYIKERKEALQKEQLAKIADKHVDCPAGHVPLPDHERKETLSMLKKNYQEYVGELNMLPIRTDTLRSQKRKMEIEKQLTKLEEAIKVFTRPKVFVKVDS
ncbi:uncharacterized protein LOC100119016 [Nasonia vitripennis]|uniref:Enkurin domain-containing protein n=1 Tax=Nasonia vitripennis TaxID=7425 RepID=A0A7M7H0S8_NASVI|nr:uncharacterized protein LOC100119016 [Nasonia vitripennis]XP_008202096.1 uncharacterized protein LOC100119016 [Nasonia vitripennis]